MAHNTSSNSSAAQDAPAPKAMPQANVQPAKAPAKAPPPPLSDDDEDCASGWWDYNAGWQDDDSEAGEFQWPHYFDGQYWRTWTGAEGGDPWGGILDEHLEALHGNENSNAQPPVQEVGGHGDQEEAGNPETAESQASSQSEPTPQQADEFRKQYPPTKWPSPAQQRPVKARCSAWAGCDNWQSEDATQPPGSFPKSWTANSTWTPPPQQPLKPDHPDETEQSEVCLNVVHAHKYSNVHFVVDHVYASLSRTAKSL